MKKDFFISVLALQFMLIPLQGKAQKILNCDSLFMAEARLDLFVFHESLPKILGGYKKFYNSVERASKNSTQVGKVVVQFVVDTVGEVKCIKILESDNIMLHDKAISLVEQTAYEPAKLKGKPIVFIITLPISFGKQNFKSRRKK